MSSYEILERMIEDYLRLHPSKTLNDLEIVQFHGGGHAIIERTDAMKWLNWHSDNHGWDSQMLS